MSSSGSSSGTSERDAVFEDLWRQLRECHGNALQELESKVSKLKKERCLDAQKLEVFYNRNQQLKGQIKSLQDAMSVLEERLQTGVCERCSVLEENLKNNQEQNLYLVTKLKQERKSLEVENTRLLAELEELRRARKQHEPPSEDQINVLESSLPDVFYSSSEPERASSSELEDGVIPDSPVRHSSLPTTNKLKKRKNFRKAERVCYEERPLARSRSFIFNEPDMESCDVLKNPRRIEVLVPNTCELETSQTLKDVDENAEEEVAETCRLDLLPRPPTKIDSAASQRRTLTSSWKLDVRLKPSSTSAHVPDPTSDRSLSLLPRTRQLTVNGPVNKKRKTEENDEKDEKEDEDGARRGGMEKQKDEKLDQTGPSKQRRQENKKQTTVVKFDSAPGETSSQRANVSQTSPTFKKPIVKVKEPTPTNGTRRTSTQAQHESLCQREDDDEKRYKVEPMWSVDPALALSMYDSERTGDQEGEPTDTDCTWISHSLLQRHNENSQDTNIEFGLALKANDSLDKMFDTSAYGEYNSPHLGRSQEEENDEEEEEENDEEEKKEEENDEEEEEEDEQDAENSLQRRKAQRPAFAHVAVIRKKDERRKLKGTTCKECEIYYAHLPEEEKKKKLTSCSRHRFLYVPPCTPENFWEVGFPSTQTCIDRGYIKEEKNPQARLRRRQPLNALFSPKRNQQENEP